MITGTCYRIQAKIPWTALEKRTAALCTGHKQKQVNKGFLREVVSNLLGIQQTNISTAIPSATMGVGQNLA